jgi:glycosyltransferase 2 family protein
MWVAAGFLLFNLSLVVRAYRWQLLLCGLGVTVSLRRLIELYFVGNFFNIALPSGFGGDVVRVVEVARDVPKSTATGTVLLDRLTGLLMLFVMAIFVLPFQKDFIAPIFQWVLIIGAVAGTAGFVILLEGSMIRKFRQTVPGSLVAAGRGTIGKLLQAVQGCGWRAVFGALAVSMLFNLMLTGWWLTSGLALDLHISFFFYLVIMPLVTVPTLIPSISGLGPRELLVPTLFATVGVPPETAVSLSLLIFAIVRLSGLLGAPIYLVSLLRKKPQKRAAETAVKPTH